MKFKSISIVFLLLTSITFFSCKKDNDDSDACSGGQITMTINGSTWTSSEITKATLYMGVDPTGVSTKKGYRLDIKAKGTNGKFFSFIVSEFENGLHGVCMDQDKTWSADLTSGQEAVVFSYDNINGFSTESDGSLTFTNCNENLKSLSGTFDFVIEDFFTEETVTATNGVFTNICFTVL